MFGATTRNVELNNWYKKVSPILAIINESEKISGIMHGNLTVVCHNLITSVLKITLNFFGQCILKIKYFNISLHLLGDYIIHCGA